jgi:UDP-N-acetylmuramoylalanine--D-glutamate ligase
LAAAHLALAKGGEVYVSDLRTDSATSARADELAARGASVQLGGHDVERIAGSPVVVVSPGIPPEAPVLRALRDRGVRWISEPEFASRFFGGALIALTGTNGKTTTAALVTHLMKEAEMRVALGGNIGSGLGPAASELALLEPPPDWYVVEVSSFQLADIEHFAPDIGVVTNLAPDHTDRYPSVEAYYADKARLFDNATPESRWVLDGDDPAVDALAGDAPGKRYYARTDAAHDAGATGGTSPAVPVEADGGFLRDGQLVLRIDGVEEILLREDELSLLGRHNRANAITASITAYLAGATPDAIRAGLRGFRPLPHRLEPVVERDGVLWVNDSKATNVAAARSAVLSLDRPVVLLLGGRDKGEDLAPLLPALERNVRAVVVYGAARDRLEDALRGHVPLHRVDGSFDDAVHAAAGLATRGDAILLAPACSSFDQFRNYEERGERFTALAKREA